MKKSYSKLNLLQKKLQGLSSPKGFLDYMLGNRKYLTIVTGYYDYIRGEVFIDDMFDIFDDVPRGFDLAVLIHLLYQDFLTQVKKGNINKQVAGFLVSGKARYLGEKKAERRVMKALTEHVFTFESIEEEIIEESEKEKKAYITIQMKESEILRGEILLHDLTPYLNDQHVTIEDLLTILYLDFINQIKEQGNSDKIQKSILSHLKSAL
ncbi:hypothetical protein SAMN05444673_6627 [Bacillus sp. OV166]|uniref:hypothetical protein n=1 Tax=Bacillus sp. OV166 TaxID=1882763 RepID=UPI000A2AE479|nr:hypothetical protein [Bacillus sp. OV166]SMQ86628.1 hypothetical protein SAMN05444673_6627 [Bacillus sp. OV166]